MRKQHIILITSCLLSVTVKAQDTLKTSITYDFATEVAVGSDDFTAFQLATNRHHVLATRPNTAYVRGAVNIEHPITSDWKLSATLDALASVHADHEAYLQQCYANLAYKTFFLEVGSREEAPVLREAQLSSGVFTKGINAKPIPQIHVGTSDFWTVPFTNDWLQVNFDFGYGKFLDSDYRRDKFYQTSNVNWKYATGSYYHQKHFYMRSNPKKRIFAIIGMEHVVQFGGTNHTYDDNGTLVTKKKTTRLKDFWDVILPFGDNNYFEKDAMEDWIFGNHIGMMTVQVGWNIHQNHLLQAYVDNPFEDGSGIRKSNGWDGQWGLQYTNKARGRQYVRGAVVEYLQTTNQSGPLHWDGNDYPEPIRSQITDYVTGRDDYYNHEYYDGYSHYGMALGNALLASPIYNKDGFTSFHDNRVKAWHIGVNGEITSRTSYLVKGSYREGWGTYNFPLPEKHHSFDAMFQLQHNMGPWQFSGAYAFDKGNIYGNCSTFDIKISYHGKIL